MNNSIITYLADETATLNLGHQLAAAAQPPLVITLQGNLGAGKTTLVRGFLNELGYTDYVKSPSYSLVETYEWPEKIIHHFDLYRIQNPAEIIQLGLSDYLTANSILLIEWPEHGGDWFKTADLQLTFNFDSVNNGRNICLSSISAKAHALLQSLNI